ncbi:alpha/beta fold hydrolase [Nocardioides sp. CFH 31398]|uniref:alpha/beta fold hydrolase n=1 Tax=Nocardioides sp. CFH 31398 TaxID=2919579 RepID=UPI001F066A33|nr:alpha/beta hydrolase [Nocardioides sp. CFH 31398]MCH1865012.1 alpha/beta hydrolase [Nocardioides sp. CFH 31398]
MSDIGVVRGGQVEIAYTRHGDPGGWPVVLLHGFPYDPRCYDEVAPRLAESGADVVVPYLRGYGPTRYVSADVLRSGAQAAFAHDLHDLVTMLGLERPIACGFDWGGRAACVAALLWPDLLGGLVTVGGYNVHDVARMAVTPAHPAVESRLWYQWYLHSEHGRRGLERYRREIARQLWEEWSPTWSPSDDVFEATAVSFDNPDFVDTVVHSYRHRYALVPGHRDHEDSERRLAAQPTVDVPTVVVDSAADPIAPPSSTEAHRERFTRLVEHRVVDVGHNPPQEDPAGFVDAVLALRRAIAG